jgi:hypothetical protein
VEEYYADALSHALHSGVPFMLGGGYALRCYAGILRDTKDMDIFCKVEDYPRILQALAKAGYRTEVPSALWLAKAFHGEDFIDIIFNSPNCLCPVDESWLEHAPEVEAFGNTVKLVPPEEMIWCKSFVQERLRFDGADVLHLIRKRGPTLDWERMLRRAGEYWEVLLPHLLSFRFVYPSERDTVPEWLLRALLSRVEQQLGMPPVEERICRGPLIAEQQYLIDIAEWGYLDPRSVVMQAGVRRAAAAGPGAG